MTVEQVLGWGAVGIVILYVVAGIALFRMYCADFVRQEHPEPTRAAFKLTMSSLRALRRFRTGEDRKTDGAPVDLEGTISAPIKAIPDRRRKTPGKHARHDQ